MLDTTGRNKKVRYINYIPFVSSKKKKINYFYLISEDKMFFKNKREDRHKIR